MFLNNATRLLLIQFELLKKSKDEAYIMADAFRIAFEQQLMRRKDQALGFTQMNKSYKKEIKLLNRKSMKEEGNFVLS